MIPELTPAEIDRFHSKVRRGAGCWPWTGETNNKGYGRFAIYRGNRRVRLLAHRVAYKLAFGVDPGVLVLRHRCDNPPCCNPVDVVTGTQGDNMRDALERGRMNVAGLEGFRAVRTAAVLARLQAGEKTCRACRRVKPLASFHANASTTDGLQSDCNPCRAGIQRAYRHRISVPAGGVR